MSNSALFSKHLCLQHCGIIFLPDFMVKKETNKKELVQVLEEYSTDTMPVAVLHPYKREYVPKRVKLFIDFLCETIQ